jgi:Ca2+/H+ antiporter, TMEM165/GDT1 family
MQWEEGMIDAHSSGTLLASFLASSVECVEAMTIVLAVGTIRGWRPALAGAGAAFAVLALLVAVLGPSLSLMPLAWLQVAIGALLVLFGMRWLRKAVLRAAGIIPLHDETAAFSSETRSLSRRGTTHRWDAVGIATSFKAVMLEGIEVVFIVIALGAVGGAVVPASLGAVAAGVVVVSIGLMLHRPLARVPENTLKFVVGVMLSAFGTFWLGEGYGLPWPGSDLAILGLMAGFAASAMLGVQMVRHRRAAASVIPS